MKKNDGSSLERRTESIIQKLVDVGLAKQLCLHDTAQDRDGLGREIDLTFVLCTNLVDVRVSVECKSRKKPLSLADIDQIKTFKRDLPGRNVFWLVFQGALGANARDALSKSGISFYSVQELETIVAGIVTEYHKRREGVHAAQQSIHRFSMLDTCTQSMAELSLHGALSSCFESLPDVSSAFSEETDRMWRAHHDAWFKDPWDDIPEEVMGPFLKAIDSAAPFAETVPLLKDFAAKGGTREAAEDLLEGVRHKSGAADECDERTYIIDDLIDLVLGIGDHDEEIIFPQPREGKRDVSEDGKG